MRVDIFTKTSIGRVFWIFLVAVCLLPDSHVFSQKNGFDASSFLQGARAGLCGLFTQRESSISNMRKFTWKYEWISQRLGSDGDILEEFTNDASNAFVRDGELLVSRRLRGKAFDAPIYVLLVQAVGYHDVDLECSSDGRALFEKVWAMCPLTYAGHELFNGVTTVAYSFRCTPEEPDWERGTYDIRRAAGTEGMLRFEEESRILIQAEGRYYKDGCRNCDLVAEQIRKGTTWHWNMKQVDGDWVLDTREFEYPTRTGLLGGFRRGYLKDIRLWGDYHQIE